MNAQGGGPQEQLVRRCFAEVDQNGNRQLTWNSLEFLLSFTGGGLVSLEEVFQVSRQTPLAILVGLNVSPLGVFC